jgi:hypothetical protein
MALAPLAAYLKLTGDGRDGLAVGTVETSRATVELGGQSVTVVQESEFPRSGSSTLSFRMDKPAVFGVRIRVPAWAAPLAMREKGGVSLKADLRDGWAVLAPREWKDGDQIALKFNLSARLIPGEYGNAGLAALAWGPFVLAYDQNLNPGLPASRAIGVTEAQPPLVLKPGSSLAFQGRVRGRASGEPMTATFVPFADAGSTGGAYRVWLRAPGKEDPSLSVLLDGEEACSREGNQDGSIIDDDPGSIVVTFNSESAKEDWYAVALREPVTIDRVVFMHGRTFHDGGWFDAGKGKPKVQVQRSKDAPWEIVGELADYPLATATEAKDLKPGQAFTLRLSSPTKAIAVRVIGAPACGDSPKQAFSSCAELQAFAPPL